VNQAIFGPRHVPDWMPFALSGSATVLTALGIGGREAIGATCLVGTVTITLFGVLHYELARLALIRAGKVYDSTKTEQIQSQPDIATRQPPAGFRPMAQDTDSVIDPGVQALDLGQRVVYIEMTREQLNRLAWNVRQQEARVMHNLNDGRTFDRHQVDRLRDKLVEHHLAYKHGRQVILTPACQKAILRAAAHPAGMIAREL